jgi:signal transduction histidine kinase
MERVDEFTDQPQRNPMDRRSRQPWFSHFFSALAGIALNKEETLWNLQIAGQHKLQCLAQVMANLLSNAAKFSPRDQVVDVAVHLQDARVRVSVTDHVPGVPENFQTRIFSKFSQADATDTRQKGGTGLGLAISKEIIERMGGQNGFESAAGHGATFWFDLPISVAPTQETSL